MQNIAEALTEQARRQPDAMGIAYPINSRRPLRYASISYRELDEASETLAKGLHAQGIGPGMRVALLVTPGRNFFITAFALLKAGAVMVCIDPGIGLHNMKACLAEAEPAAFIGIPKAHIARWLFGWAKGSLEHTIVVDGWLPMTRLPQLMAKGRARTAALPATDASDVAAILFTSGSTGIPKGVVYQHSMFVAQVAALQNLYAIEAGEVDCATFPLFALFAPALGMSAVVPVMDFTQPGKVDPLNLRQVLEEFKVTNCFGSPALLNRLGRWAESAGAQFPHLRRVISAGAPVPGPTIKRICAMLSAGVQVFTPYGATECLPVCNIGSDTILAETWSQTEQGAGVCVGKPVPGLDLHIIGIDDSAIDSWDDQRCLPTGQIGEVVVKAAQATAQYFNRPDQTQLAKIPTADGGFYHRMGDLGYLDEAGRLWFCGRKSQRVICADVEHYTVPCEGIFNAHPGIFRSALVGVERNGKRRPAICVELEPGQSWTQQLAEELRDRAMDHTLTDAIREIHQHPSFPVDIRHNAKINREVLASWAQDH